MSQAPTSAAATPAAPADTPTPPLPHHLNIVALETFYTPLPPLNLPAPYTYTLTEYERSSAAQVAERIKDADIIIITVVPVRGAALEVANSPRLRLIAAMASGTDSIDLQACAARGIRVLNSPNCNTAALAEHVAALYLSTRRSLVPVMRAMCRDEWAAKGTVITTAYTAGVPPRSCSDETVGIIGYGGVGQAVAKVLGALGMQIIVAGRRGSSQSPQDAAAQGRVPFDEVLRRATVLVVCCPRLPETMGLIGARELALMPPDAILVNVARGNIVDEEALVAALREGRIAGAGVDVYDREPATRSSSPVVAAAAAGDLNLVATAHTAWVAASTRANYQRVVVENISGFLSGNMVAERIRV